MSLIGSEPGRPSLARRLLGGLLQCDRENERWHRAILDILAIAAPAESLLDIGCWDGSTTLDYIRVLGCRRENAVGIEYDEGRLRRAGALFKTHRADVDREPLPVADDSMAVVICNQVLEHTKNVFFLMGECERVTKPGGYMAFGLPNLSGLMNRLYLAMGRQPPAIEFPSPHVRGIVHKSFVDFVRRNSAVELVAAVGSTLYPLPCPLMEWFGRKLPGLSAYSFYLVRKKEHRRRSYWKEVAEKIPNTPFLH